MSPLLCLSLLLTSLALGGANEELSDGSCALSLRAERQSPPIPLQSLRGPKIEAAEGYHQVAQVRRSKGDDMPSTKDCRWVLFEQPLSHFDPTNVTFQQRVCIYDGYVDGDGGPIFFYTGNEAAVDLYVNNTGLMWELGKEMGALLVFAEHRYFGESSPTLTGTSACLKYLTLDEALADFAKVAWNLTHVATEDGSYVAPTSKIVTFGGSYGARLSATMRLKYPHLISGAIASSMVVNQMVDTPKEEWGNFWSWVRKGMDLVPHCGDGMVAATLVLWDAYSNSKASLIAPALNAAMPGLCRPLEKDTDMFYLNAALQSRLETLAQSSFPFESDYMTVGGYMENPIVLPPFPLQAICEKFNEAAAGVTITGDMDQLIYTMTMNGLTVEADWSDTKSNYSAEEFSNSGLPELMAAILEAQISMWGEDPSADYLCPESKKASKASAPSSLSESASMQGPADVCTKEIEDAEAWQVLVVNDLNYAVFAPPTGLIYAAPPTLGWERDWTVQQQIAGKEASAESQVLKWATEEGLPGARPGKIDLHANDFKFSLKSMVREMSNVFFTVGELDPWGGSGLTKDMALQNPSNRFAEIKRGGHHVDTFFSTDQDYEELRQVREDEKQFIKDIIDGK
ncbi:PRCP [Symbiodinium natans]|uniref:PRCP protein n=1 Tax=Symbiodinium natans TaxID=878477 RepID=A0A812QKE2_9DINO|nr:PRCP [Symbiodinium natans]